MTSRTRVLLVAPAFSRSVAISGEEPMLLMRNRLAVLIKRDLRSANRRIARVLGGCAAMRRRRSIDATVANDRLPTEAVSALITSR